MSQAKKNDVEVFPYEHTWTSRNRRSRNVTKWKVRYRFVPILAPQGWKTYPGQECHEGRDGLLIENSPTRWWEQDLWGCSNGVYHLDIGCYGGKPEYVCYAHAPDWRGEQLERVSFARAEEAAAWAERWMAQPDAEAARARKS